MSPMVKQPLTVELALLGFLRQRPMYGYELHQILSETAELGLVWRLKQSQLYALLGKLEDEGYLSSEVEPQGSKAPRKVFNLTPSGEQVFLNWVQSPVSHGRDFRIEFLAKLYFAQQLGGDAVTRLVANQREVSRALQRDLQRQAASLDPKRPYNWLVLEFRSGQLDAILRWLDLCEQRVNS
jgi:PadR family transcriptional regulator, regulatory protein AphA